MRDDFPIAEDVKAKQTQLIYNPTDEIINRYMTYFLVVLYIILILNLIRNGALINLYFKAEVLKELVKTTEKGIALTIAINDETNTYDQNVSAHVAQTKEQRENKERGLRCQRFSSLD